ncbi:MAG TPA: DUF1992 domain-containing protein [Glaciihabitans sp.]|jgi:hypothetical protein|nr:DUF1992 domain-containing protein [Glaciihabitans sp.]
MTGSKKPRDTRLNVARYVVDKLTREDTENSTGTDAVDTTEPEADAAGQTTMHARAQYVEIVIAQAMRRGDFDNLKGSGKPLTGLNGVHDPDWWIRQKIEREKITGLGPPALTLRTEDAELHSRLDAVLTEREVRDILEDFNTRVISARRQLQGGPPVVTPTRDIPSEVELWNKRRSERRLQARQAREQAEAEYTAMSWRDRRKARRNSSAG